MKTLLTLPILFVAGAILLSSAFLLHNIPLQPGCALHETLVTTIGGDIDDGVKLADAATSFADEEDEEGQDEEDGEKEEEPSGWDRLWDAPTLG